MVQLLIQKMSVQLWAAGYILQVGGQKFYEKIVTYKRAGSIFANEKPLFWPADAVFTDYVSEITYASRCDADLLRLFPVVARA